MNNYLKIGAASGLIAGFVAGIILDIFASIATSMGLWEPYLRPIATNNIAVNIPLFGFWGVLLGIIYSRAYNVIPKKGVTKGLVYGFFLYLIAPIRIATFLIPYAAILTALATIFCWFFTLIVYGLLLGILYAFLGRKYSPTKEEPKTVTYDMKRGILPGAIAGLLGGVAASVFAVIGHVTGYWGIITAGEVVSTIDYWMSQAGTHILINIIWGTFFGFIYPRVYNLVPDKRVRKGFYYGLIVFLITAFHWATWVSLWFVYHNAWKLAIINTLQLSMGAANAIVFGLVLGVLYRKPSD